MALVDIDSWNIEYQSCVRLEQEIRLKLKQRLQYHDLGIIYDQLTADLEIGLEQLRQDIVNLKAKFEATHLLTSTGKLAERQRLLAIIMDQWKEHYKHYYATMRKEYPSIRLPTDAHQAQNQNVNAGTSALNDNSSSSSAAVGIPSEEAELKRRQAELYEDQNRGLELLAQTISRQRELATQLGNEVEDQNEILDNLTDTMERVDSGVQRETSNIRLVSNRDSTWVYWTIIILLFLIILIVLLLF